MMLLFACTTGYYHRAGDPDKWLLVFNGGGWCVGTDAVSAGQACSERAGTSLGTSTLWSKTLGEDGWVLPPPPPTQHIHETNSTVNQP
jgi:hypothetical protein